MKAIRLVVLFLLLVTLIIMASGCNSDSEESSPKDPDMNNTTEVQDPIAETEEEVVALEIDSDEESTEEVNTNTDVTDVNKPVEWVRFTNEDKNFELMYPSNWIIVDSDSYGIILRPKPETQTTFYVDTKTTMYADYSYDDFVDEMIGDVIRIRDDCEFSEPETIQINDYPFVLLTYSGASPDGTIYYYRSFFTANNLGYQMYYVADEVEYELYQPIMEEIALSFKFLN